MRFSSVENKNLTSFKKRRKFGYKHIGSFFGEFSFILEKGINMEYILLYNYKRTIRRYNKKKKNKFKKIWMYIHRNCPLTRKNKNARMGKGKGSFIRYCARIKQNHILLEFSGFGINYLLKMRNVFFKKTNIPVLLYTNFFSRKHHLGFEYLEQFFCFIKYKR